MVSALVLFALFALGYRGVERWLPKDWIMAQLAVGGAWWLAFVGAWFYITWWLDWARARRSRDPRLRAEAARPTLHWKQLFRRYGPVASVLPVFILSVMVMHRLVPVAWGPLAPKAMELAMFLIATGVAWLALDRIEPLPPSRSLARAVENTLDPLTPDRLRPSTRPHDEPRSTATVNAPLGPGEPLPAPAAAPVGFAARLVWHGGRRECAVHTSARLRDQLLHLHLSSVEMQRIVDFVPAVGARVSVALGGEDSLVTILPVAGDPLVVTNEPGGLATAPVGRAEDGTVLFPPASAIPVEVAIDVLDRYFTTGELPGQSAARASGEPLGPTTGSAS
ncbi:Imm1 family immunity protein [Catellatospora chokoriensis]|uniref:Imm1 family immunity protein n=1 Tax=Catellatospora chokoriensis TaxID=310353 RepID=UPI00177C453D|nr:Imm1 family immunity protein [Catellatospora chokoriensis]